MKLINQKHVKDFAIKLEAARFPDYPGMARKRVSRQFLELCESHLEAFIRAQLFNRSNGAGKKTI